jgi:eukaryotic-like serine/threonine-protein kinase
MAGVRKLCVVCSKVYRTDIATCPDDGTALVIEAASDSVEIGDGGHRLGHVLGNYRLQRVVGEGGAGTVYEAEHLRLGRRMAIKLLHPSAATPTMIARFFNEAKAVNEIRHPNIIDIEDFVTTDGGEHFMVMELLEGIDLRTAIAREGKLAPERVAMIGEQVASALSAVHKVNIVHRDLKPDNIFLTKDKNGQEVAKLLDFGVAKFTDQQGVTRAGTTMGTPQYMAPEMIITGREAEVGPGCDIYALGMVMYEALTGNPAFNSGQIANILRAHCYEPVIPPSQRRGEPVPPVLEAAVMKCLEKMREHRFADVGELCIALRATAPVRVSGQLMVPRAAVRKANKRRRIAMMMPAFAMMIAAIVLQVVPKQKAVASSEPERPVVTAPVPQPPPQPRAPAEPAKPTMLTITLASKPTGAQVFLGDPRKLLGTAPATLIIPMGSDLVKLTARFPDGTEVVQTMVPDREIPELVFEKKKATKPVVGKTPTTKPTTTPTKSGKPDDRDSTLDPFKR